MPDQLELPDIGWREVTFDTVRLRDVGRMEGRRTEAQSFGTPYWTATYVASLLGFADFGKLDAFIMSAGDDGETFLGHDVFRPRPIAMNAGAPLSGVKAGGGVFDGTASLTTITSSRVVVIGGLPAGFILSVGDYVEFRMSALVRSLHRITVAATADGAGAVTLSIKYGLDVEHFTTDAVVNFEKPACVMQVDPGSFSGRKAKRHGDLPFSATEMFFS